MSVQITELEISITDNATGATEKIKGLANALNKLRFNADNQRGLTEVADSVASLNGMQFTGLARLQKVLSSAVAPAQKLADALERVQKASSKANLSGLSTKASKASSGLQEKVATSAPTVSEDVQTDVQGYTQSVRQLGSEAQAVLDNIDLRGKMQEWIAEAQKAYGASTKFVDSIRQIGTVGKTVLHSIIPSGLSRIVSQFGRLMKMKVMRTIIANLLQGFSQGLQNVYYWAKATGDGFANTMDTISTSLNYAKNSIGAAFSSVLNAVAPVIDKLIDILVQGINYVNMFFAVLNGQSTYTKAKKVAVEYGNAAAGAIGNAAGAARDLQETLSLLDFDELNQLQEQATGGGGGGGGGGAGGGGTNYADMFEKADIPDNFLTRTAGWLKENFDDILPIIEAIGAGILAWKISNAFSSALGNLLTLKQKIGFTLTVAGFTLEALSAYSLGKNGFNWKDAILSVVGAATGIAGLSLMTGSVATGLTIGLPLSIALFVTQFIRGKQAAIEELWKNSEAYKKLQDAIDSANLELEKSLDLKVKIKSLTLDNDPEMNKILVGEGLLNKIREFEGSTNLSSSSLAELNGLVEAYNSLELTDITAQWDIVNGRIKTNVDDVQEALKAYKEYYEYIATGELIAENEKAKMEAELGKTRTDTKIEKLEPAYQAGVDYVKDYLQQVYPDQKIGDISLEDLTPGGNLPALADIPKPLRVFWRELGDTKTVLDTLKEASAGYSDDIDAANKNLDVLYGNLIDTNTELGNQSEEFDSTAGAALRYQNALYVPGAKDNPNWAYGGKAAIKSVAKGMQINMANQPTTEEYFASFHTDVDDSGINEFKEEIINSQMSLDGFIGKVVTAQNVTTDWNNGATFKGVANAIDRDLYPEQYAKIGLGIQSVIETPVNNIKANGSAIFNNVNKNITGQNYPTTGGAVAKAIQGKIDQTSANGKTIYGNVNKQITSQSYGVVGGAVANAIKGKIDGTTADGAKVYKNVDGQISGKDWKGSGSGVASKIGSGINTVGSYVDTKKMMNSMVSSMNSYTSAFRKVGQAIGDNLVAGIRAAVGTLSFTTTATAGNTTKKVVGKIKTDVYPYAEGGWPSVGELFLSRENGPEMVGRIGSKTAVANNDQIANALAKALTPLLSGGGTETTTVNVKLDSATIARASFKGQKAVNKQYNVQAQA